jgi:xylose isomerase
VFSADRARQLKEQQLDLGSLRTQGYAYERLDQLTMEILFGVR